MVDIKAPRNPWSNAKVIYEQPINKEIVYNGPDKDMAEFVKAINRIQKEAFDSMKKPRDCMHTHSYPVRSD
jgi:hypothetical protein